jgi:hypothetical protein
VIFVVSRPAPGAGLELVGAVHDDRVHAEDGQVHRAGAVHAGARGSDLLEQDGGLRDAHPVAAVLLRRRDAEPAALGELGIELAGELVGGVLLHPVLVLEPARELADGLADRLLVLGQVKVHGVSHLFLLLDQT